MFFSKGAGNETLCSPLAAWVRSLVLHSPQISAWELWENQNLGFSPQTFPDTHTGCKPHIPTCPQSPKGLWLSPPCRLTNSPQATLIYIFIFQCSYIYRNQAGAPGSVLTALSPGPFSSQISPPALLPGRAPGLQHRSCARLCSPRVLSRWLCRNSAEIHRPWVLQGNNPGCVQATLQG